MGAACAYLCIAPACGGQAQGYREHRATPLGHGARLAVDSSHILAHTPLRTEASRRHHRGKGQDPLPSCLPAERFPFCRSGLSSESLLLGRLWGGHEHSGPAGEEAGAGEDSEPLSCMPGAACGVFLTMVLSQRCLLRHSNLQLPSRAKEPLGFRGNKYRCSPLRMRGVWTANQCPLSNGLQERIAHMLTHATFLPAEALLGSWGH